MLWGAASPPHPDLAAFLHSHGWPDVQVRVPPADHRGGGGGGGGDGDWIAPARAALAQLQFAITTPVLSPEVADRLRAYVFRLAHAFPGYHSSGGCVG